jgi:hypothetical protein
VDGIAEHKTTNASKDIDLPVNNISVDMEANTDQVAAASDADASNRKSEDELEGQMYGHENIEELYNS